MVVLRARGEAGRLATLLAAQRIQVSVRGADGVRVAFQLSNTLAEVRQRLHALASQRWLVNLADE
jgi:3-polyprenyl-4-hydroxybenzoate decarboxylase